MPEFRNNSDTKLVALDTKTLHLRIVTLHICVGFSAADKLVVPVWLETMFTRRYINCIHHPPPKQKIVYCGFSAVRMLVVQEDERKDEKEEVLDICHSNTEVLAILVTRTESEA